MTEEAKRTLDSISMGPSMVITVQEKDGNYIQYAVFRLKKDFAVVSHRNIIFHQVMEDFWWLVDFLRGQRIDYEQVEFVAEFDSHKKDMTVLYTKPQKVELSVEEIEKRLCLEPGTLVIKSEYDSPELEEHYNHFGM